MTPQPVTEKPVLVTGSTGFLATHVVEQLLQKGYKVRGSVRNVENKESYAHLTALQNADKNLELVSANLNEADCWKAAVDGCEYVIHVASPFFLKVEDPQKDLVDPAVNGVKHVFAACKENGNVKKVVQTSSCAALTGKYQEGKKYTEADWNTESSLTSNPYMYSKALAEKTAHDFVKENPGVFKLAVICPFLILGDEYAKGRMCESVNIIKTMMKPEQPTVAPVHFGYCDVRDVANAHILAMEKLEWEGRTIVCESTRPFTEIAKILARLYPKHEVPTAPMEKPSPSDPLLSNYSCRLPTVTFDNTRSLELGVTYRPLEESLKTTVDALIEKGAVAKL